jgi:hypothetical protein
VPRRQSPPGRPSPARRYEAWLAERGLSFGRGRRFAASRYLDGDGGYVGAYEAELDGMGGVLRGAPSKLRRLIEASPILLVAIFLRSDAGIGPRNLGPRNIALEEELSQLDWSAFTPHISAAPFLGSLVPRFDALGSEDVKPVVTGPAIPAPIR